MENRVKNFKIFMILLYSIIFMFQIYYSISLLVNGIDMSKAIILNDLRYTYEAHSWTISSRMILALMQTHSLNVNVLSAFMVFFLILSALNSLDILYFGILLIALYFTVQTQNKGLLVSTVFSFCRLILYIMLIIIGGVLVLQVFLVGNTSVAELVKLGSFVVPIFSVVNLFLSIICYIASLKLELRES